MTYRALYTKILEKKEQLDTYRPLPPALVTNLDAWFTIELAYTSNAIEGNTLSKSETALVVEKGLTVGGKTLREHLEAVNHVIAFDLIKHLVPLTKQDITLNDILDIHRIILKSIDDAHAGVWRTIAVKLSHSNMILPSPMVLPDIMNDFLAWLHETQEHIVKIAADAHYKFVAIHPFVDGNGRTARLFMNLLLMQAGYPPVAIGKEDRSAYINALEKADLTHDMSDFYVLIFTALERSLDIYLEAAEQSVR